MRGENASSLDLLSTQALSEKVSLLQDAMARPAGLPGSRAIGDRDLGAELTYEKSRRRTL